MFIDKYFNNEENSKIFDFMLETILNDKNNFEPC